jgi:tRNA modification GTPase
MQRYETDDIIYALATGWTRSALAIIRVSGNGALYRVAEAFSRPDVLRKAPNATMVHGFVQEASGDAVDEVVVAVTARPHGYTGEDALEITCQRVGGRHRQDPLVLWALGLRAAQPGEFTYRAFLLHGKWISPRQRRWRSWSTPQSDVGFPHGAQSPARRMGERLGNLREKFLTVMAAIEVQLDYSEDELDAFTFPEEQLEEIATEIERISSHLPGGASVRQWPKVVLAGRTNAGKSSLFNLLLKENRSIVSEVPGTTRDYIEEACVIDGFPVRLYDTAGLRECGDVV